MDLTIPQLWFPEARKMTREIYYHHGPTNSGKTKTALDRLKKAKKGLYLAPLRLLAWEISENLNSDNIRCSLITGQEKHVSEMDTHKSSTIEMCDIRNQYDVAVIDEI